MEKETVTGYDANNLIRKLAKREDENALPVFTNYLHCPETANDNVRRYIEDLSDVPFPSPAEKLVFLGAKTTCKDRWRQVLNEADRIEDKYLFTLQQGVSSSQMKEMKKRTTDSCCSGGIQKNALQRIAGRIYCLLRISSIW